MSDTPDTRERDPTFVPVTPTDARGTSGRDEPRRERDRRAFQFDESNDETAGGLLRQLADQATHLAERQTELVKAEVRESVNDLKQAGGAMAGAAVLGLAGLGVTLMGVAFLLAEAMDLWLATLIVGIATLAGAYAMYAAGQKKLNSSSMGAERTRDTLKRAPDAVSGHNHEGR